MIKVILETRRTHKWYIYVCIGTIWNVPCLFFAKA